MKEVAKVVYSRQQFERALQAYVSNDNKASALAAERDKVLEPINKKYDPQFAKLQEANEEHFAVIKQYCEDNRGDLFTEAKSMELLGAKLGYREGKDKVMVLEGFVEKEILAKMQKSKVMAPYIRTTPAIDKAKLIKEKPKGLAKFGLKVDKEESFFVDAIKTETDTK